MALKLLGQILTDLSVDPSHIQICNKLGWKQIPLAPGQTKQSFETNAWVNLTHDAVMEISYQSMMDCYAQGNELLGGVYKASVVALHDPDEYLNLVTSDEDLLKRKLDILVIRCEIGKWNAKILHEYS